MKSAIGIRELKANLASVLRRVRNGETVTVTVRKQPVALLLPIAETGSLSTVRHLVKAGMLSWSGGKPSGADKPPLVRGASVSEAVVEDRR